MQRKEIEKAAIIEIVKNSKSYDYQKAEQVQRAITLFQGREDLRQSEFGKRYLKRLDGMWDLPAEEQMCILCVKNKSVDGVVCQECLDNVDTVGGEPSYEKQIEDMQYYLARQMKLETRRSAKYTDDIVHNLDSSMDRLATQSSMKATNRMVAVTLALCCINTFCIIGIFILMLFR